MRTALVALSLVVATIPSAARAVPMLPTPFVRGPAPVGPTSVRLVREELELSCPDRSRVVPCELVARLALENPTDEVVELELGWTTEYAAASLRGDLVRETGRSSRDEASASATVVLPPHRGTTVELVVSIELWPTDGPSPFLIPALTTRHLVLGDDPFDSVLQPIEYAPGAWTSGAVPVRLVPHLPGGWEASASPAPRRLGTGPPTRETDRPLLRIAVSRPSTIVFHGGPFLAAGGSFERGFRLRAGYEIGFMQPFLASASIETGFDDVVLAAQLEAALPQILYVPSLGVAAGVPVRVAPDVEVGIRIELSAVILAGFVSTFDYYPGPDRWEIALLGRLSI